MGKSGKTISIPRVTVLLLMKNVKREGSKKGHLGPARISNSNIRAISDPGKAAPKPN